MNDCDCGPRVDSGLETKFCGFSDKIDLGADQSIAGYASLFGVPDKGGDIVERGAYGASLAALQAKGQGVKMLWQHDPLHPIGVWDEIREDATGLWVKGRLLSEIEKGREAAHLIQAGAIDGLSIGYRTKHATRDAQGHRRLLEVELWEVSLVTFPMLPEARLGAKAEAPETDLRALANALRQARAALGRSEGVQS